MKDLLVVLAFCLLLADHVVLQGTARLQPVSNAHNGALEKNGSSPLITLPPHLRDNRFHFVTSGPVRFVPQPSSIPDAGKEPASTTTTTESTSAEQFQQTTEQPQYTTTEPPETTTTQRSTTVRTTTTERPEQTTTQRLEQTTTQRPTTTTTTTTTRTTTEQPIRRQTVPTPSPNNSGKFPPHKTQSQHTIDVRSGSDYNKLQRCPRSEDIHPCECVEVATPAQAAGDSRTEYEVETVAFCKNIRNVDVLREALRGMQGHHLTYLVMDSVHLPPFPNDLFKNIGVGWMEVLNSTMQFHQQFFQCYDKGCS